MALYEAGQLEPAFAEFAAAYAAMPDPRRDAAGRELLVAAMHATLLEIHDQRKVAAPLCRLRGLLQAHVDAWAAASGERAAAGLDSTRVRQAYVADQLAVYGPDACAAPVVAPKAKRVVVSAAPAAPSSAAPQRGGPSPPREDAGIPSRHLRIAGGVTLGLGAALLGVMTYGISVEGRRKTQANAVDAAAAGRPLTQAEHDELLGFRADAMTARHVAIGTGIAAGLGGALGTTLLVLARRSARNARVALTPWWTGGGGGLTLAVRFLSAY